MAKTEQAVAKAAPTSVALPAAALAKMQAAKHKDVFRADELMLPWFQIVQSSSGYMKRGNANFIQGAAEGDMVDNLTKRLRSSQLVILVKFEVHYTTFKPNGGPLVKQWFLDSSGYDAASFPPGKDFGKKIDADGNVVQKGPMYYVLLVDPETGRADPAAMSFGSTQASKVRRINMLAREDLIGPDGVPFTPPIYSRLFDVTTRIEQGKGDNADKTFGGWWLEPGDLVLANEKFGAQWYAKAEAFREQIELGNVRPQPPTDAGDDEDDLPRRGDGARTVGSGTADGGKLDADIPF